jgi:hypothetical protein
MEGAQAKSIFGIDKRSIIGSDTWRSRSSNGVGLLQMFALFMDYCEKIVLFELVWVASRRSW